MLAQRFFGEALVLAHDNEFDGFACFVVRHAHHGRFQHAGHGGHHIFHFIGIDIEAADQNHVFLAVHDADVAFFVHHADVARFEIAVGGHGQRGFIGALPVAGHDLRAFDGDFAALALGHFAALVIEQAHVGIGQGQADGAAVFAQGDGVTAGNRRGFRQAVALANGRARALKPLLGHGALHRRAAAHGHFQMAPVHLVKVRVMQHAVEQRIDRRELVKLVAGQLAQRGLHVARVGNEHRLAANAQRQNQAGREGKDVIERQGADADDLLAFRHVFEHGLVPRLRLQGIGHQVAVQQHRALGHARGAAGVLQNGNVIGQHGRGLKRQPAPLGDGLGVAHRARQAKSRNGLAHVAQHKVHHRAAHPAQALAHAGEDDVLHLGLRQAGLHRVGKVFHHHQRPGARVIELVLQLARGVERIDIHHHHARAQHGGHRFGVLGHVGHHHRHAVALFQSARLQKGRQRAALALQLGVAVFAAHVAQGRPAGELAETGLKQRGQRGKSGHVNAGGHAFRVLTKPGALRSGVHIRVPLCLSKRGGLWTGYKKKYSFPCE